MVVPQVTECGCGCAAADDDGDGGGAAVVVDLDPFSADNGGMCGRDRSTRLAKLNATAPLAQTCAMRSHPTRKRFFFRSFFPAQKESIRK